MTKSEAYGVARAVLATVGGILVSKGYVDSQTAVSLGGALATIAAAAWSVKSKRR